MGRYKFPKGHKLYQGDCLEIMPTLMGRSVDMVFADLPYGMVGCYWDSELPLDALWEEWGRLLSPKGVVVLTAVQPFTSVVVSSNYEQFRHEWVYQKTVASNFANAKRQPMREHESVLVFAPAGDYAYYPIKEERKGGGSTRVKHEHSVATMHTAGRHVGGDRTYFLGKEAVQRDKLRFPSSVQLFNNRSAEDKGYHPTRKPVELMRYLIKTYTKPGGLVLDCVMGGGSTGVAALDTGRQFIGIEQDEDYFVMATERIAEVER